MGKLINNLKQSLPPILAGVMISISCLAYLSCDNPYVGSILFSLGVLNIMFFKLPLFTAVVGRANIYVGSKLCNTVSKKSIFDLISIWLDNFIGVLITVILVNATRLIKLQEKVLIIVQQKQNDTFVSLFILSIFCGLLMFIATQVGREDKSDINKLIRIIFCIAVFILVGFEHCVADMFYFIFAQRAVTNLIRLVIISIGNGIGANIIPIIERSINK